MSVGRRGAGIRGIRGVLRGESVAGGGQPRLDKIAEKRFLFWREKAPHGELCLKQQTLVQFWRNAADKAHGVFFRLGQAGGKKLGVEIEKVALFRRQGRGDAVTIRGRSGLVHDGAGQGRGNNAGILEFRLADKAFDSLAGPFDIFVGLRKQDGRGSALAVDSEAMDTYAQHLGRAHAGSEIGIAGKNNGGRDGPVLGQRQQISHKQAVHPFLLSVGVEGSVAHLDIVKAGEGLMLFRHDAARIASVIPVDAQEGTFGELTVNFVNKRLAHLWGVNENILPPALFTVQQIGKLYPEITGIHKSGYTLHTILHGFRLEQFAFERCHVQKRRRSRGRRSDHIFPVKPLSKRD